MSHNKNPRVLIIDDDPDLCRILKTVLSLEGMEAEAALSGEDGIHTLYRMKPDLVLLDIMMPEVSGWEVTRRIRQVTDVPIIIVSALSQSADIIRSLEAGADDFISKPFEAEELLARIRAVMRRSTTFSESPEYIHDYDDGYLAVNLPAAEVYVNHDRVPMSDTEYRLFEYLFLNAGQVCPIAHILDHIWGAHLPNGTKYLHVYIWKLRNKIEKDPHAPIYIQTDHGTGYRFERSTYSRRLA